ncbi:DUF2974 domain-containing protein [Bifidobacterium stellenboschense]|uniref:Uncharacterized protein n=1 Tax=Bifidobacterium stellenboschense TaxID=762211 RepID=A0A087DR92_9BIFI|nr:DUF2974 domain-containing protein [Bifidobacterium stellenboschense]KFI98042.1 hypothetical protein BSTEL_0802 [Bifidobacterium stellenboschense]
MGNVFDYVTGERRPLTDPDAPFNEVDALVFASLAYEDVARISPTLALDETKDAGSSRHGGLGGSFAARLRAFEPRHPWLWAKGLVREPFESVTLAEAERTLRRELAGGSGDRNGAASGNSVAGAYGDVDDNDGRGDAAGNTIGDANGENTPDMTNPSAAPSADPSTAPGTDDASGADKPDVQMVGLTDPNETHDFFAAVSASPRFAQTRLGAVAEHVNPGEQTQFAAMTFMLPDGRDWRGRPRVKNPTRGGTLVIAFRGTDDSLIGWKEDFNMAFQYPVPAQRAASAYLDMVARLWRGPIVLTGHSKGGNLAVYAAMNADAEVQRRIRHVYSLDGPGFPPNVVTSRQYLDIQPKVTKIVPSSSIVGQIFETPEPCRVVTSDSDGIMQHFSFSWQVEGDRFVTEPDLASSSQLFNQSLNAWMAGLTIEQRERAVDALFAVLHANGATTFSEVMAGFPASIPAMIASMLGLPAQDRRHLLEAVAILVRATMARSRRRGGNAGASNGTADKTDTADTSGTTDTAVIADDSGVSAA